MFPCVELVGHGDYFFEERLRAGFLPPAARRHADATTRSIGECLPLPDAMEATVQTKQELIDRIQRLGPELRALGVERLGIFGSFLRGQTTPDSDVDILVEFAPGQKTYDHFIHLAHRLEATLQRPVDLVTRESLSPYIGPRILEQTEYVSLSD